MDAYLINGIPRFILLDRDGNIISANMTRPSDPKDGVTYDILYDILIKQTGDIHSDWDGTPLDVDAYGKAVFEPYDLKWLTRST